MHLDDKPDYVVVGEGDHPCLVDFGLASRSKTDGIPAYMAPGQRTGDAVTPAADLGAFGLCVIEVLSGHLPADPRETLGEAVLSDVSEALFDRVAVGPDRRGEGFERLRATLAVEVREARAR